MTSTRSKNLQKQVGIATKQGVSRRSFVAGSAIAAASLGLAACTPKESTITTTINTEPVDNGEWTPVGCWSHCEAEGLCHLKAYMVDGICTRLKTDDTREDTPDNPQGRTCALGRSRRLDVFGPQRIKYPMKRKNWQPGGGANAHGELRGIDEWERISWEEALDLVANEMQRIKDEYGNRAILGGGWNSKGAETTAATAAGSVEMETIGAQLFAELGVFNGMAFGVALSAFGGYVDTWSTMSQGTWQWSAQLYGFGQMGWNNDRFDCRNVEHALLFGSNPAVTANSGWIYGILNPMKAAGCKFYFIDPMYHDTCASLGAEWIPIRPGTDKAMMLAMAYVMFTEDNNGSIVDWDFLNKYCLGHDADHMPEGEDPKGNFKDYVLGTHDGAPKTPEWQEPITGVSADKVYELARVLTKENKVAMTLGLGPARTNDAECLVQLNMILGCMGGHMGKSGHMTACSAPRQMFCERPDPFFINGPWLLEEPGNIDDTIQKAYLWNALREGKYYYSGVYGAAEKHEEREINIKCIYNFMLNLTANSLNTPSAVEFFKTVDLAVCNSIRFDDNARFFDIVLPVMVPWEKGSFTSPCYGYGFERCQLSLKIVDAPYEIKDEIWIGRQLLERWGLDPDAAYPYSYDELYYNEIYETQALCEDGTYEPLISFTEEEVKSLYEGGKARAEGRISWTDFCKQGIVHVERSPGDAYVRYGAAAFIEDPEKNPTTSESGKLEFYSKAAVRITQALELKPIDPIPTYVPTLNGYESTFSDFENGVKGEYPFQMFTPKYYRCKHSHFDALPWLREAFVRPVFVNAQDAAAKGVKDGDIIRVWNANGSILRPANVTERIMPGVVGMPHGGMPDIDQTTGYDLGGASNWLTYGVSTGMGTDGYNSQVCNFEKSDVVVESDLTRVSTMTAVPTCQLEA